MSNKENAGRERLREALRMQDALYMEKQISTEETLSHSEEYEAYMQNLLNRRRRKKWITHWKRRGAIAAGIMLLIGGVLFISPVRKTTIQWIRAVYATVVGQEEENKEPHQNDIPPIQRPEWLYTLSDIPDHFMLQEQVYYDDGVASTIYYAANRGNIYFSQYPKENEAFDSALTQTTHQFQTERFLVDYKIIDDQRVCYWRDDGKDCSLSIPLSIPLEEVIVMIDSAEPKETNETEEIPETPKNSLCVATEFENFYSFSIEVWKYLLQKGDRYSISGHRTFRKKAFIASWGVNDSKFPKTEITLIQYEKGTETIDPIRYEHAYDLEDGERTISKWNSYYYNLYCWEDYGYVFTIEVPKSLTDEDAIHLTHCLVEITSSDDFSIDVREVYQYVGTPFLK